MTSKRTIDSLNEAAFLSKYLKMVMFIRLDLSSGVQRFHTEIGPKTAVNPTHGSESYTGIGDFGGISGEVKESTQGAPIGLGIVLSGVSSSLINKAFVDDYFRRDADLMVGLEDEAGDLIADPEVLFSGYMDSVSVSFVKNSGTIAMSLESRGTNFLTASDLRTTDEELQAAYPGDLGGEYIYRMADLVLRWGAGRIGANGQGAFSSRDPRTGNPFLWVRK